MKKVISYIFIFIMIIVLSGCTGSKSKINEKKVDLNNTSRAAPLLDNNPDNSDFNINDSKYHYMEYKDTLSENDSMEEGVVLITETIQDKTDSRKSTKYIIPLSIVGAVLSLIIESSFIT